MEYDCGMIKDNKWFRYRAAVVREVYEEAGVKYEIDRLAFIHENFFTGDGTLDGMECHEIAFYFIMKPRGTRELFSDSYTSDGIKEQMHWIPVDELDKYRAYPTFFKEKLNNISTSGIEHIITRE